MHGLNTEIRIVPFLYKWEREEVMKREKTAAQQMLCSRVLLLLASAFKIVQNKSKARALPSCSHTSIKHSKTSSYTLPAANCILHRCHTDRENRKPPDCVSTHARVPRVRSRRRCAENRKPPSLQPVHSRLIRQSYNGSHVGVYSVVAAAAAAASVGAGAAAPRRRRDSRASRRRRSSSSHHRAHDEPEHRHRR